MKPHFMAFFVKVLNINQQFFSQHKHKLYHLKDYELVLYNTLTVCLIRLSIA